MAITKDVFSFDDGLAEKQATFLLTALLENANVRLNSWRQRRFAKYFTEVGKRTLEEIPADKHLFPDQFHERMKSEHNHSTANNSLISKPPLTGSAQLLEDPPSRSPFVAHIATPANKIGESANETSAKKEAPRFPQPTKADYPFPKLKSIDFHLTTTAYRLTNCVQNGHR